jgi:hypothetical protein
LVGVRVAQYRNWADSGFALAASVETSDVYAPTQLCDCVTNTHSLGDQIACGILLA